MSTLRIVPILLLGLLAWGQTPIPGGGIPAPKPEPVKLRIVLDPGHGGDDRGAKGPKGLKEKDAVLELALTLKERLQ